MKKQLKVMVAALAVTALATPAFALTVDTKGFYEIRGQYDHNLTDGTSNSPDPGGDDDRTGLDQRLRLWTEAAADENVKLVFAIEADTSWGAADPTATVAGGGGGTYNTGSSYGDIGADGKGQIEIKNAYLDFNLVPVNTNVKAGTQMFKIGGGFIANDDATGLQTATKFGEAVALKLYWVKALEGDFKVTSDDVDFYGAQVDIKAGEALTISPVVAWTRVARNNDVYFGGFDLAGKFDKTRIAATVIKNWGDNLTNATATTADDDNVDGLAAYVGIFQGLGDAAEISLEGAWVGDDGRAGGEFVDGSGNVGKWGAHSPTEMLGGARYDARGGIGQSSFGGDLYTLNQCYGKLGFSLKTSEATKLTTYVAHLQQATGTRDGISEAYGQEVGGYYDITIGKGLTYSLMGAYLFNDDFGVGSDDVWKLGNALTYKF